MNPRWRLWLPGLGPRDKSFSPPFPTSFQATLVQLALLRKPTKVAFRARSYIHSHRSRPKVRRDANRENSIGTLSLAYHEPRRSGFHAYQAKTLPDRSDLFSRWAQRDQFASRLDRCQTCPNTIGKGSPLNTRVGPLTPCLPEGGKCLSGHLHCGRETGRNRDVAVVSEYMAPQRGKCGE